MIDIEKLIESAKICCGDVETEDCIAVCISPADKRGDDLRWCRQWMIHDLHTALSTLRAENEKLRAEVESLKKGHCAGCSIPAVKAEQIRDLTDAPKLRAELEQVKAERDAAIKDLKMVAVCDTCANEHNPSCPGCNDAENWDWRGGQKERRYENI